MARYAGSRSIHRAFTKNRSIAIALWAGSPATTNPIRIAPASKECANDRTHIDKHGGEITLSDPVHLADYRRAKGGVYFDRHELRRLLDVYSRRVMTGEWKDYAIDHQSGRAIFSIFRHSFDSPLFAIAKRREGKRCAYQVFRGPQKIKQSSTIEDALSIFDKGFREIPSSRRPR